MSFINVKRCKSQENVNLLLYCYYKFVLMFVFDVNHRCAVALRYLASPHVILPPE